MSKKLKLGAAGPASPLVSQVDDFALVGAVYSAVGSIYEVAYIAGMPVIAPRLPCFAIHPLLHNGPMPVISDEKAMEIEIEAVLDGSTINLRHEPACADQLRCIDPDSVP